MLYALIHIICMIGNTGSFMKAYKAISVQTLQIAGLLIHMILFSDRYHHQMTFSDSRIRFNAYVVIHH